MAISPGPSTLAFAAKYQEIIDSRLSEYAEFGSGCPSQLAQAIRYSLLAPGKRLRPILVLMSAQACGGSLEAALPVACAVEMIHAYSLIHDDLPAMDDDDMRRGRPTCHVQFGEATAILAGDALIPLAFLVITRDLNSAAIAARCCQELAQAAGAEQLVGGQADDLDGPPAGADENWLESVHMRKTAALLAVSLKLGAIVAECDERLTQRMEQSGKLLGLAFQISDDLLDISGNPATIGKGVCKDQQRGRLTYPGLLGIAASQQRVEHLIQRAVACWRPLGDSAGPLKTLAEFLVQRTH